MKKNHIPHGTRVGGDGRWHACWLTHRWLIVRRHTRTERHEWKTKMSKGITEESTRKSNKKNNKVRNEIFEMCLFVRSSFAVPLYTFGNNDSSIMQKRTFIYLFLLHRNGAFYWTVSKTKRNVNIWQCDSSFVARNLVNTSFPLNFHSFRFFVQTFSSTSFFTLTKLRNGPKRNCTLDGMHSPFSEVTGSIRWAKWNSFRFLSLHISDAISVCITFNFWTKMHSVRRRRRRRRRRTQF